MTPDALSPPAALIYIMVMVSAADAQMTDAELQMIGDVVQRLPAFRDFDADVLVPTAEACGEALSGENGIADVLALVKESLPDKLRETAYALALEVAAADVTVQPEEARILEIIRHGLNLDRLTAAAIERGARARYMRL